MPNITYVEAIREATREMMVEDETVILIGEGVPDPKAVFGSTRGLKHLFPDRVFDMPVSENGLTGACVGAAITGLKPIIVHQRIDFTLYAMDQIVNNAAKWHSMFGGQAGNVPLVIRSIVGRGWGQGNQHSQNLAHIYASFPGLKVVTPSSARDAAFLLKESVRDKNPVLFVEHRWLHNTVSEFRLIDDLPPLGKAKVLKEGSDLSLIAYSYMTTVALKLQEVFEKYKIYLEVVDLRSISPLDTDTVYESVKKTQNFLVLEEAWGPGSVSANLVDILSPFPFRHKTTTLQPIYSPSTPHLSKYYYPSLLKIGSQILSLIEPGQWAHSNIINELRAIDGAGSPDVPDPTFKGPF